MSAPVGPAESSGGAPSAPWRIVPNRASVVSLLGLSCGVGAPLLAFAGRPWLGLVAMMAAGIADMLDGVIARRMALSQDEARIGETLDSLVDAVSFGAGVALWAVAAGLRSPLDLALAVLYTLAAVWRLATFTVIGVGERAGADPDAAPESRRVYTGLPVTWAALVLPLLALIALVAPAHTASALRVGLIALPLLFLSGLPVPRPGLRGMIGLGLLFLVFAGVYVVAALSGRAWPLTAGGAP